MTFKINLDGTILAHKHLKLHFYDRKKINILPGIQGMLFGGVLARGEFRMFIRKALS